MHAALILIALQDKNTLLSTAHWQIAVSLTKSTFITFIFSMTHNFTRGVMTELLERNTNVKIIWNYSILIWSQHERFDIDVMTVNIGKYLKASTFANHSSTLSQM